MAATAAATTTTTTRTTITMAESVDDKSRQSMAQKSMETLGKLKQFQRALAQNTTGAGLGLPTNRIDIFGPSDVVILKQCYSLMLKHNGDCNAVLRALPEAAIKPLLVVAKYPSSLHAALFEDWIINLSGMNPQQAMETCKAVADIMTAAKTAPLAIIKITQMHSSILQLAQAVVIQHKSREKQDIIDLE